MADTTLSGLTGANPALSALDNLKTSPPVLKATLTNRLNPDLAPGVVWVVPMRRGFGKRP